MRARTGAVRRRLEQYWRVRRDQPRVVDRQLGVAERGRLRLAVGRRRRSGRRRQRLRRRLARLRGLLRLLGGGAAASASMNAPVGRPLAGGVRGHVARAAPRRSVAVGARPHGRNVAGNGICLIVCPAEKATRLNRLISPSSAVQVGVGLGVLAEDLQQLVAVGRAAARRCTAPWPSGGSPAGGRCGRGRSRCGGSARTPARPVAAQLLVAGLDVDARVVGAARCCCSSGGRRRCRRSRSR